MHLIGYIPVRVRLYYRPSQTYIPLVREQERMDCRRQLVGGLAPDK